MVAAAPGGASGFCAPSSLGTALYVPFVLSGTSGAFVLSGTSGVIALILWAVGWSSYVPFVLSGTSGVFVLSGTSGVIASFLRSPVAAAFVLSGTSSGLGPSARVCRRTGPRCLLSRVCSRARPRCGPAGSSSPGWWVCGVFLSWRRRPWLCGARGSISPSRRLEALAAFFSQPSAWLFVCGTGSHARLFVCGTGTHFLRGAPDTVNAWLKVGRGVLAVYRARTESCAFAWKETPPSQPKTGVSRGLLCRQMTCRFAVSTRLRGKRTGQNSTNQGGPEAANARLKLLFVAAAAVLCGRRITPERRVAAPPEGRRWLKGRKQRLAQGGG